jgi:hypothetical protein
LLICAHTYLRTAALVEAPLLRRRKRILFPPPGARGGSDLRASAEVRQRTTWAPALHVVQAAAVVVVVVMVVALVARGAPTTTADLDLDLAAASSHPRRREWAVAAAIDMEAAPRMVSTMLWWRM